MIAGIQRAGRRNVCYLAALVLRTMLLSNRVTPSIGVGELTRDKSWLVPVNESNDLDAQFGHDGILTVVAVVSIDLRLGHGLLVLRAVIAI